MNNAIYHKLLNKPDNLIEVLNENNNDINGILNIYKNITNEECKQLIKKYIVQNFKYDSTELIFDLINILDFDDDFKQIVTNIINNDKIIHSDLVIYFHKDTSLAFRNDDKALYFLKNLLNKCDIFNISTSRRLYPICRVMEDNSNIKIFNVYYEKFGLNLFAQPSLSSYNIFDCSNGSIELKLHVLKLCQTEPALQMYVDKVKKMIPNDLLKNMQELELIFNNNNINEAINYVKKENLSDFKVLGYEKIIDKLIMQMQNNHDNNNNKYEGFSDENSLGKAKFELMLLLVSLLKKGIKLTKNYTMDDSYQAMKQECDILMNNEKYFEEVLQNNNDKYNDLLNKHNELTKNYDELCAKLKNLFN